MRVVVSVGYDMQGEMVKISFPTLKREQRAASRPRHMLIEPADFCEYIDEIDREQQISDNSRKRMRQTVVASLRNRDSAPET